MQIYLFGEDSYSKSTKILKNIILKSFFQIDSNFNDESEEFSYAETEFYWLTLQSNQWKNKKPTSNFDSLCKLIADIYLNEDEFIFWHIDADITWQDGFNINSSSNIIDFQNIILKKVANYLSAKGTTLDFEILYNKLILIVPFYSIESWLYENYQIIEHTHKAEFQVLQNLKHTHGDTFDMIHQIKNTPSVQDKVNLELSNNFPSSKIYRIGMSYAHFLDKLKQNESIKNAIPKRAY